MLFARSVLTTEYARTEYSRGSAACVLAFTVPLVLLCALAGCDSEAIAKPPDPTPPPDPTQPEPVPAPPAIQIPAQGTSGTLDVATWNLLFFGAANQGPGDDPLQMARVRDVILGTDADLWGVQEVTDADAFAALVEQLPGYQGFLASDASVSGGSDSYDRGELKVGLIYKPSVAEVAGARVILSELDYEFAGRPPMEVQLRVTLGGESRDVVLIVLHAKAVADETSWERRMAARRGAAGVPRRHLARPRGARARGLERRRGRVDRARARHALPEPGGCGPGVGLSHRQSERRGGRAPCRATPR